MRRGPCWAAPDCSTTCSATQLRDSQRLCWGVCEEGKGGGRGDMTPTSPTAAGSEVVDGGGEE